MKVITSAICMAVLMGAGLGSAAAQNYPNGVLVREDGIYTRCDSCGTVESIEQNIAHGGHGTAGAVIGAIAGGVLGNQVGRGRGRDLATVGGAVGGGFAGHAIGDRTGSQESWTVRVRMGNGTIRNVEVPDASALRNGDIVQVQANGEITRVQ